jgi:hypothetical protein
MGSTIALATAGGFGFRLTGGGTLFQNADGTNVVGMSAPLTVVGSQFRVQDASSNGGVGNLGTGAFTLDGGTLAYWGVTNPTSKAIALTANGGTIEIGYAPGTLTANGAITGFGPLTKTGPGTLAFGSSGNTFTSLTVNAGTVQTANDNTLGAGPITVNAGGTLNYTSSTSTNRTVNLLFGALAVNNGATLTLNDAIVNGGFVRGAGTYALTNGAVMNGVTTAPSTTLNVTGAASFINVTNGSPLTIAPGLTGPISFNLFTNQGSGSITIGAVNAVNASDFQTYGTLSINPATVTENLSQTTLLKNVGTSQVFFDGGSRTFIGTVNTATFPSNWPDVSLRGQPTFVAGIDLNGKNATVAAGLLVNNGYVEDSTNNGTGTATIVADFGALVKGSGFFQNSVQTVNGGKFQAGNSPGAATFGKFVLGPGGVSNYVFAINDATGEAGPTQDAAGHVSGWGLIMAISHLAGATTTPGDFTWTSTPADKLTVSLQTLLNPTTVGVDVPGMMDHFDPTRSYVWPAVVWTGSYAGPTNVAMLNDSTSFDTSGFVNPIGGMFGWALDAAGHTLSLTYHPTAVPEPGTIGLTVAAAASLIAIRRRRVAAETRRLLVRHSHPLRLAQYAPRLRTLTTQNQYLTPRRGEKTH